MTTIALQQELIKKISIIKDKKKLAAIKEYVEAEFETFDQNGAIKLTAEMIALLEISQKQIKEGQFTPHEQVMAEAAQWLKEKV